MLTISDIKKILHPTPAPEPADGLNVLDTWSEYDETGKELKYLCFDIETIDPERGTKQHLFKAIRFVRVKRLPKSAKQSTSFMDMQSQVLSAVHSQKINLITIIANVIKPRPEGLLYLYGVQCASDNIDDAKHQADLDYAAFIGSMMGTFAVLHMRALQTDEALWLQEKMREMKYLTAVRGIPKANTSGEDAGNKGMGGANINPDSEGTMEEFIRAMADYEYVLEILSTPVYERTLKAWSSQTEKQMTEWNGQLQGQKSLSMNLSIPMMYMTSTGTNQGWTKNYTDARSVSYTQGESYNTGYSQSVGESLSQSIGKSLGHSYGTSYTRGVGTSQSFSNGVSHNLSQGTTKGVTQGETIGRTTGQSISESLGYSQGVSKSSTSGVSVSQTKGSTFGQNVGSNTGMSLGKNMGTSLTNSFGTSLSQGQSINRTKGSSATVSQGESMGNTMGRSFTQNNSLSHSLSRNNGVSYTTGGSASQGASAGYGQNANNSNSKSANAGGSLTNGGNASLGGSQQAGITDGNTKSHGASAGAFGTGFNGSDAVNKGNTQSAGTNGVVSGSQSLSDTRGIGASSSSSLGESVNHGANVGLSKNYSAGKTAGVGESYGTNVGSSYGESYGASYGQNQGLSIGNSSSVGYGANIGMGQNASKSMGTTTGASYGQTAGQSQGQSVSQSFSTSVSRNMSSSASQSYSQSATQGYSQSISNSESQSLSNSISNSQTEGYGTSQSKTNGVSNNVSYGQTQGESVSDTVSNGYGQSKTEGSSLSRGQSTGKSEGQSTGTSIGSTGAYTTGTSGSMGLGPSIGYSKSYQWVDQEVKDLLELFEYQNERLKKALRGEGAFYTYVYIAAPTLDALATAQAAAKSTWQNEYAMVNPLQVMDLTSEEQQTLLYRFSAFSTDVSRERVGGISEYRYATVLLPNEYVAYTHLPRVSEGGIDTIVDDIPKFRVPAMMTGDIYMGTILNSERYTFRNGYRTPSDYRLEIDELMHGLITGQSRSGKTVAAMRFIKELANARRTGTGKRLRIVIMDPKQDWRGIARFVSPDRFRFYSLGDTHFRPINMNPCKIPYGVTPQHWIDGLVNIYCRAYGLLERGKQMMSDTFYTLYDEARVFNEEDEDNPSTWHKDAKGNILSKDWKEEISYRSSKVTFHKVYKDMKKKKDELESAQKRAGNDTLDAYSRLMERLSCFSRKYSIEYRLFSAEGLEKPDGSVFETAEAFDKIEAVGTGLGIDELIGADDVTVFESFGLESTFANFIFGIITSGFYKVAKSFEGGYLHPSQYETVLVIEEANKVLTGNDTAGTGSKEMASLSGQSEFEEILDQSAGYGLFIIAITQKISAMPSSIVANCGLLFIGKISQPADIELATHMIGRDPKIQDKDVTKWLPKSPTGWFIMRSNRTYDFVDAEAVLVQVERLHNPTISNPELEAILLRKEISETLEKKAG